MCRLKFMVLAVMFAAISVLSLQGAQSTSNMKILVKQIHASRQNNLQVMEKFNKAHSSGLGKKAAKKEFVEKEAALSRVIIKIDTIKDILNKYQWKILPKTTDYTGHKDYVESLAVENQLAGLKLCEVAGENKMKIDTRLIEAIDKMGKELQIMGEKLMVMEPNHPKAMEKESSYWISLGNKVIEDKRNAVENISLIIAALKPYEALSDSEVAKARLDVLAYLTSQQKKQRAIEQKNLKIDSELMSMKANAVSTMLRDIAEKLKADSKKSSSIKSVENNLRNSAKNYSAGSISDWDKRDVIFSAIKNAGKSLGEIAKSI